MSVPIIIATHGRFRAELLASAELILGPIDNAVAVSLLPEEEPVEFGEKLRQALPEEGTAIILTDLNGGTPSNVALATAGRAGHVIVSGVNLPLLVQVYETRQLVVEDAVHVATAIEAAREGIIDLGARLRERTSK